LQGASSTAGASQVPVASLQASVQLLSPSSGQGLAPGTQVPLLQLSMPLHLLPASQLFESSAKLLQE